MKLFHPVKTLALALGIALSQGAGAAILTSTAITYVSTAQGGGVFEHRYTIDTTGLDTTFDQLSLFFDENQYASISIQQAPTAWDAIVVEGDPFLASDAFFDAIFGQTYDINTPLIDTFTLQVTPAPGMPQRDQYFQLLQSDSTTVVAQGFTSRVTTVPVPEPASLALVLVASLAAAAARRSGKPTRRTQGEVA